MNVKNSIHGWKPLDEAIHMKDRQAAIYIVTAKKRKAKEKFGDEFARVHATIDGSAELWRKVEVGVEFADIWTDFLRRVAAERYVHVDKNRNASANRWGTERVEDVEEYNLEENTAESRTDNGEMRKRKEIVSRVTVVTKRLVRKAHRFPPV